MEHRVPCLAFLSFHPQVIYFCTWPISQTDRMTPPNCESLHDKSFLCERITTFIEVMTKLMSKE